MLETYIIRKLLTLGNMTNALKSSLTNDFNQNNACFFLELMKYCCYKYTDKTVLKYIQKHFCLITENNKHLHLSIDSVADVLSNSGLKLTSEIEVLTAGDSWIKYKPLERKNLQ